MCKNCDKEVQDMDILDSDLANLPYTLVRWQCVAPNCKRYSRVKDYGIAPLYHWGRRKDKWINIFTHVLYCGKHWKLYRRRQSEFAQGQDPLFPLPSTVEAINAQIVPIANSKTYKPK